MEQFEIPQNDKYLTINEESDLFTKFFKGILEANEFSELLNGLKEVSNRSYDWDTMRCYHFAKLFKDMIDHISEEKDIKVWQLTIIQDSFSHAMVIVERKIGEKTYYLLMEPQSKSNLSYLSLSSDYEIPLVHHLATYFTGFNQDVSYSLNLTSLK